MKIWISLSAKPKEIPTPQQLTKYKGNPAFEAKYETDPERIKLYHSIYDRVVKTWKANYTKPAGGVAGTASYFQKMKSGFDKEFPGVFSEATFKKVLFSDKLKTAMDSWDHLTELAYGKLLK